MSKITPLKNISAKVFLRDYWQKKPLLIRGAVPECGELLSPDELKKLAGNTTLQSRVVVQGKGSRHWDVAYGPFAPHDFAKLPTSKWTLLVQDVDKVLPRFNDLMERFRFVPYWRMDDVMVSYAAPQGSVGPHLDQYDVFLLQGSGKRRWHIGSRKIMQDDFVPDLELKILPKFKSSYTFDLEEGDLLYLPPRFGHHGVALDDCMTYSIGFRAPSYLDLFQGLFEHTAGIVPSDAFYEDPGLPLQSNAGEISSKALRGIYQIVKEQLPQTPQALSRWFGRYVTEPRHMVDPTRPPQVVSAAEFRSKITDGATLRRSETTKVAFFKHSPKQTALFINGKSFELKGKLRGLAEVLCSQNSFGYEELATFLNDKASCAFIADEISQGHFYIIEE
jgi:50S ribosomal protein L16 3-hydroxylase